MLEHSGYSHQSHQMNCVEVDVYEAIHAGGCKIVEFDLDLSISYCP
jgi:hypothetical protein